MGAVGGCGSGILSLVGLVLFIMFWVKIANYSSQLATDAGGTGLNLQHASVVVNMDVPWNPAVLEQRIGRVHRLGQR